MRTSRKVTLGVVSSMILALGVSTGASSAFADDPVSVDLSTTATNYTSNDPAPTLRATVDPILGLAQTVASQRTVPVRATG